MVGRFNLGDILVYNNKMYKITSAHLLNWSLEDPLVYGITLIDPKTRKPLKAQEFYVCANILESIPDKDIQKWRILYGK